MADVDWTVEADIDGDGTFETELNPYLANQTIEIARGVSREGEPQTVEVTIDFDNAEGYFQARNIGAGEPAETLRRITTGTPIRITATHDGVGYTRFSGWVRKVKIGRETASALCEGLLGFLGTAPLIYLTASETRTSMTAISALMTAAGRTADDLDVPAGGVAFPWHFAAGANPAAALLDAAASEMAGNNLYEIGDGRLRAETNTSRQGVSHFANVLRRFLAPSVEAGKGFWLRNTEFNGTTVYDRTGNGLHGTLVNGAALKADPVGALLEPTVQLDGSNDHITIADAAALEVGDTFTFGIVMHLDTLPAGGDDDVILRRAGWQDIVISNTTDRIIWRGPSGVDMASSAGALVADTPYLVIFTKSGATLKVWVNGVDDTDGTVVNQTFGSSYGNTLYIGNWDSGSFTLPARVADVWLADDAFTAEQVAELQAAFEMLPLDEASDLQVLDGWAVLDSDEDVLTGVEARSTNFLEGLADDLVFEYAENMWTRPAPTSIFQPAGTTVRRRHQAQSAVTAFHAPEATIDYAATENQDGSGADLTATVTVVVTDLGGGFFDLERTTTTDDVYWPYLQVRAETTLEFFADQATASVARSLPAHPSGRTRPFDIPWGGNGDLLFPFAVQELHAGRMGLERIEIPIGTMTDAEKAWALNRELGDLVYLDHAFDSAETQSLIRDWLYVEGLVDRLPVEHAHIGWECRLILACSYAWRNVHAVAFDDFARDDASGALGSALTGQAWTGDTGFDLDGGTAIANTDDEQVAWVSLPALSFDQVVDFFLTGLTGSDAQAGCNFRLTDADNHYRLYVDLADEEWKLSKYAAGAETVIASGAWTVAAAVEGRALCQGGRLRAWVNGVLVADEDDMTFNTGLGIGPYSKNADGEAVWTGIYGQAL